MTHAEWVAAGFCPAIYTDDDEVEHWCRMPVEHDDPHVAPWEYNFPKSETMVRWTGEDDDPQNIEFAKWQLLTLPIPPL